MALTLRGCFDDKGNLKFDPYRLGDAATPLQLQMNALLFDENGFIRDKKALKSLIEDKIKVWGWDCTAVALYHADRLAHNTKTSYPTYYYFR